MKDLRVFAVLLVLMLVTGCATTDHKYLPAFASTKSEEANAFPHPVNKIQEGIKSMVVMAAFMPPEFNVEFSAGGGFFSVIAKTKKGLVKGESFYYGLNQSCHPVVFVQLPGTYEDYLDAKILQSNKDGAYLATLGGQIIPRGKESGQYDIRRFNEDGDYQDEIFNKYGMNVVQNSLMWRAYRKDNGIKNFNPDEDFSATEITAGTEKWTGWENFLVNNFPNKHRIGDKIYLSKSSLDDFRIEASPLPKFSFWNRFFNGLAIPVGSFLIQGNPVTPIAANVAGSAVNAKLNDDWSGPYARAKGLKEDAMPRYAEFAKEIAQCIANLKNQNGRTK